MVYIGIDVGGTGIQIGVVDEQGNILERGGIVTRADLPVEEQIKQIADCALEVLNKSGYTMDDLKAVGVGVPGVVDPRNDCISFCNNLGWRNLPFGAIFRTYLDKPVYVDNDATVAGLAESVCGLSAGTDSSVFVTLGTGVGSGIVIHGKVWSGAHGVGSELGHVTLEVDGEPCTCGTSGCLEQYCSATAIIRMAREQVKGHPESRIMELCGGEAGNITAKMVFDAAKEGDTIGKRVFRRFVHYLSMGLVSVIQFLDPDVIVLGGGVSKAGDFLLEAVRAEVPLHLQYKDMPYSRIELAKLGADAGIIGAAMLGR